MLVKNLTRKIISNKIYQTLGCSKNISSSVLDDFIESIVSGLIKNNKIKISSFGTFKVLNKKERTGRNPKTGVIAKISARKIVNFKASALARNKLNQR